MRLAILFLASIPAVWDGVAAQEPVDPDVLGELDSIAVSPNESENGWPLYEEVLKGFQHPPKGAFFACSNVPGSPGWDPLLTWLDQNRDALQTLVTASGRARYGMSYRPGNEGEGPIATVSLLHNRLLVNLLCVAAREAEADGLVDDAIGYVHSAHRIGMQIADRRTFIDQMIGLHLIGIASREARRMLVNIADVLSTERIETLSTGPILRFLPRPVEEVMGFELSLFPKHYGDAERVKSNESALRQHQEIIASQIDTTRAVFEIVRYRHAAGRYPGSLDVFDSGVLGNADRYRYFPPEGTRGVVLYTLGEDGEDDFATLNVEDLAAGRTGDAPTHRLVIPVR